MENPQDSRKFHATQHSLADASFSFQFVVFVLIWSLRDAEWLISHLIHADWNFSGIFQVLHCGDGCHHFFFLLSFTNIVKRKSSHFHPWVFFIQLRKGKYYRYGALTRGNFILAWNSRVRLGANNNSKWQTELKKWKVFNKTGKVPQMQLFGRFALCIYCRIQIWWPFLVLERPIFVWFVAWGVLTSLIDRQVSHTWPYTHTRDTLSYIGDNRHDSPRGRGNHALESKDDQPRTPDKQDDGSTYFQSTKEVNENQLKRKTSYDSSAAKTSNDAWGKEDHQPKASEKRESATSYQQSARQVSKNMFGNHSNLVNLNSLF